MYIKSKVDIIYKNAVILTMDDKGTVIDNGAIAVVGNKIEALGSTDSILNEFDAEKIVDANGKVLMPGLINTHTHTAMTLFRGFADDLSLHSWLYDYIFPAERKFVNSETVEIGDKMAVAEMIKGGTTCFSNMYYYSSVTADVVEKAGIRAVLSEGIINPAVTNAKSVEEAFVYSKNVLDNLKNRNLVSGFAAVHAIYTSTPEIIQRAKQLSQDFGVKLHMHLAETKTEFDYSIKEYGKTPVQYLDSLGVLDDELVAAHCVWLTEEDIKLLAERQVGIAHNPECNMKISSGIAPVNELIEQGAKIGLGTDGVASNNNLNMIQEMHTMALLHKVKSMVPTVLPAEQVVRIATVGGAKVLGKENEIGSLELGKKADFILLNLDNVYSTPFYNIYSTIVYSLLGNEVTDVVIDGNIVMENKKILTLDEEEIKRNIRVFAEKLKSEL